jgi:hypothetical protein
LYEPCCFTTNSTVTTLNLTCLLFGFTVCNLCTCRFHLELSSSWSCAIVLAPINIGFNLCGAFTYQNELHRHKASDSIVMTQHYTSEHSFFAVKQELSLYKFSSARHPIACNNLFDCFINQAQLLCQLFIRTHHTLTCTQLALVEN